MFYKCETVRVEVGEPQPDEPEALDSTAIKNRDTETDPAVGVMEL
ncbi:MAG TPA: hypothetical protein VFB59_05670 [Candidatus Saccharimonadales bacterium]|nr:hypothetical protein [Candidatus Saccharimonadales bacterium]